MADLNVQIVIKGMDQASAPLREVNKSLGRIDDDLGRVGRSSTSASNTFATASKAMLVGVAAVGAAIGGLGVAAFKLGEDFDAAYDSIRIGTGATGEALEGLQQDFRDTLGTVPDDMDKVSTAITELNKRTGATGEILGGLSQDMLNLSRITKTDLTENIADATRVFGDWGIGLEDSSRALDKIFVVSQKTGVKINDLMKKVVQFGAPLRAMNFSFDESIALLGKWEKEGVNAELVLGSLRIAMGNFARDNVPMREGLEKTFAEIQRLGPGAESTALAMKVFGARAGPDMAAAILEGRFAIADLVREIEGSGESITSVAKETMDGSERMQIAWNKLKIAAEPVAEAVFNAVGKIAEAITDQLPGAITAVQGFFSGVQTAIDAFKAGFGGQIPIGELEIVGDSGEVERKLSPIQEVFRQIGEKIGLIRDGIGTVKAAMAGEWKASPDIHAFHEMLGNITVAIDQRLLPAFEKLFLAIDKMAEQTAGAQVDSSASLAQLWKDWGLTSENIMGVIETMGVVTSTVFGAIISTVARVIEIFNNLGASARNQSPFIMGLRFGIDLLREAFDKALEAARKLWDFLSRNNPLSKIPQPAPAWVPPPPILGPREFPPETGQGEGFQTAWNQWRRIPGLPHQPVSIMAHGGEIIGRGSASAPSINITSPLVSVANMTIASEFDRDAFLDEVEQAAVRGIANMWSSGNRQPHALRPRIG